MRLAPTLLVLILASFTVGLTVFDATSEPDGKILFLRKSQIYTIRADGSNLRQVTSDRLYSHDSATWSPDGRQILFRRSLPYASPIPDPVTGIFVMNADGSGLRTVSDGNDWDPVWSPDGNRIAFMSFRENSGFTTPEIILAGADGGRLVNLSRHDASDERPVWSPDGSKVAFVRRDAIPNEYGRYEDIYDILTVTINRRELRVITRDPLPFIGSVAWSPDGTKIMFTGGNSPAESHLFFVEPDGSEQIRLPGTFRFPNYSPDGTRIAFQNADGLFVMNTNGSDMKNVIGGRARIYGYDWSPDSSQLLYVKGMSGPDNLYLVDVDGGEEQQLTDFLSGAYQPDWQRAAIARGLLVGADDSNENWKVSLSVGAVLLLATILILTALRRSSDGGS